MSIALDMDGVLAATKPRVFEYMGESVDAEDMTSWAWPVEQFGADRFLGGFEAVWSDHYDEVQPRSGVIPEVTAALGNHFEIDVVTARPGDVSVMKGKAAWLERHNVVYDELVSVDRDDTKADLDYDIFVDDKPALVGALSESDNDGEILLMDHAYNRDVTAPHVRVQDLEEVMNYLVHGVTNPGEVVQHE